MRQKPGTRKSHGEKVVKETKWGSDLYRKAFGKRLKCIGDSSIDVTFAHFAVALAAYQMSGENNPFDSPRDVALSNQTVKEFPLAAFTHEENLGHDLFYGVDSNLNDRKIWVNAGGSIERVGVV